MVLVVIILLLPTTVENAYNELEDRLEPPQTIYHADMGDYELKIIWIDTNEFESTRTWKVPLVNEKLKRSSKIPFKRRSYGKNIKHIRQIETKSR